MGEETQLKEQPCPDAWQKPSVLWAGDWSPGPQVQAQWGHHAEACFLSTASVKARRCSMGHPACLNDLGVGNPYPALRASQEV